MIVHVDTSAALPVFEQLRAQIERLIASGQLHPGTRLPTIRELARDLDVARGTIAKAYEALARDGLVETAGRNGTVVLDRQHSAAISADLDAAADTIAVVARQLGVGVDATHAAVDRAIDRLQADSP